MSDQLRWIFPAFESGCRANDTVEVKRRHPISLLADTWPSQMRTAIREINDELFHYDYPLRISSPSKRNSRTGAVHVVAHEAKRRGRIGPMLGRLTMQFVDPHTVTVAIYQPNGWTVDTPPEKKIAAFELSDNGLPEPAIKRCLTEFVNWCLQAQSHTK